MDITILFPVEDDTLASTGAAQIKALVLRLVPGRVTFARELYWMLGWRMGHLLYCKGFAAMWSGLVDYLVASDRLKNRRPPLASDTAAILQFYNEVKGEK